MLFFLEYSSEGTAGRVRLEERTVDGALTKARTLAGELQCNSAVLLHSDTATPAYGAGAVVAAYSRTEGWHGQPYPDLTVERDSD